MANKKGPVDRPRTADDRMRERFFAWGAALAVVTVAGNFALMGYLAWSLDGHIPEDLLRFWISESSVKVLVIMLIIARNIFPRRRA